MRRIVLRLFLLLPFIIIAAGFFWLRSSLPLTEGRLVLPGLAAEVRIDRDALGIPTIIAANERDAAFALGFTHAQDRLFQMDMMRRTGAGRLSELFGTRTLGIDRFLRTLGLYRSAERQYANLSPELRALLDAYAAGVNAYIAHRRGALPAEYYIINAAPEPWRPADTLVWGKLVSLELAGSFRNELLRARLVQRLTPEEMSVLYPPYPKGAPLPGSSAALQFDRPQLDAVYASLPDLVGPHFASNNWVVDGRHTVSGKPLLANDPHLRFTAPSLWYLARIETPGAELAGATSPGTPFLFIGHNARIAWGFTTTGSDVADLFIERVDPGDPTRYLTPDGSQPFAVRREEIRVRGADPVTLTVRETRHGPVLSDLGGDYVQATPSGTVLALRATWLMDDDRTPEALWGMNHAGNWREFRAALKDFAAPQQNIVYADVDGNIGFMAPARVPIRGKGDSWLPAPGWSGEYDWKGFIPFDQLPSLYNPASGRVVTANNKIVPDSYPYYLGHDWDLPYRAERINQMLDATPKQSPDASAAIQADTLSLMAKRLLPLMVQTPPDSPRGAAALARLKDWDARMDRGKVAPLLFVAWLRELNRTLLAPKLGKVFEDYWGLHPDVIHLILTEHTDWCDDRATAPVETCAQQLSGSLDRALAELERRFGQDMDDWRWGRPHEAQFTNQLWASVPVLGRLFATTIPADGGYDTVNRGATSLRSATDPYADVHGSTLRMIVDLSDIDGARFLISPGESGNVLSPHYGDLMQRWRDFAYVTFDRQPSGAGLVLAPP
jgi:penicillin amidase